MRAIRVLILMLLGAAALDGATLARRPYVQNVGADHATILWTTTGSAGVGEVRLSPGASAPSSAELFPAAVTGMAVDFWQHRVDLTGLRADTVYRYRVTVDGEDVLPDVPSEQMFFRTSGAQRFQFLAFGDSGDGGQQQYQLAAEMLQENPSMILHMGDIAYFNGLYQQYEDYYFKVYWPLMRRAPVFPSPGNHDYVFADAQAYVKVHAVPAAGVPAVDRGRYYSFDWGEVHFVALDTNTPFYNVFVSNGEMLRWLEADLAQSRQRWRVVYFHHPPFPTAVHTDDTICKEVRDTIAPILERQGVHLVLNGHEHLYDRTKPRQDGMFSDSGPGTTYVISGGAGSSVYSGAHPTFLVKTAGVSHYLRVTVTETQMTVQAVMGGGKILDEFQVVPTPRLTADGVRDSAVGGLHIAAGGLVSLYGTGFTFGEQTAGTLPWPKNLGSVTVTVNGKKAPLSYVSAQQINLQLPFDAAGDKVTVRVEGPSGTASAIVAVDLSAPAIFRVGGSAAITHLDGRLVTGDAPATGGEWLVVYLTGMGAVKVPVEAGAAVAAVPLPESAQKVDVLLDGVAAAVAYAGLAPGLAGVNQVNFRVPAGSKAGSAGVQVVAGGVSSESVAMPVR